MLFWFNKNNKYRQSKVEKFKYLLMIITQMEDWTKKYEKE